MQSNLNTAKLELTADYNNKVKKAAPANLLDNSDFTNPVNQRGQNSYNGIGYNIDRWRFWEEAGILAIHDGYVSFKSGALYQYCNINIDPNKKYTAVYMDMDGTLYILCGKPADNPYENNLNFYIEDDNLIFRIWNKDDNTETNIKWAALYEGEYTADTLPEYRAKGYGVELSECQRYYIRWNEYERLGLAAGDGQHGQGFLFIPKMRVYPTVNFQNMYIGYNLLSVVAMEIFTMGPNTIGVNITTSSNFGSGLIYDILPGAGGYCEFVADL